MTFFGRNELERSDYSRHMLRLDKEDRGKFTEKFCAAAPDLFISLLNIDPRFKEKRHKSNQGSILDMRRCFWMSSTCTLNTSGQMCS
ncbi:hypothetical protein Mp_4g00950 [Marchantia polymorpha subsp. ruderalis]|uniref:Uncharacterized protein n=2 Tax=Marchantia polymorpha TaxID=3197 RepID=A0AAF6B510_MARPO|nr:hypothetical protein MARPO_0066s0048 [Marchantia polymorpha]BBN07094.1 hypothetical protein Mp_4g00950 [Marchantia polymorpha subsp. ruderalis]|eukprot:PTQ36090.1 hypothetical protein MARPO_0066s0048 [Marchantia polymorpha]